jgi:hypothetical protein
VKDDVLDLDAEDVGLLLGSLVRAYMMYGGLLVPPRHGRLAEDVGRLSRNRLLLVVIDEVAIDKPLRGRLVLV